MFGNLGASELIIIFLVVLLLFGAKRIPEIARGLGKGIREFKDATTDIKREMTVDEQMRLNQPQYGGMPRDQRPYDQQAFVPPPAPAADAVHPAYGAAPDAPHPAYGTPPQQNG